MARERSQVVTGAMSDMALYSDRVKLEEFGAFIERARMQPQQNVKQSAQAESVKRIASLGME